MKKLLIIIGVTILFGCVKEELETSNIPNLTSTEVKKELIIESYLTNEMSIQLVKLSKPTKIGDLNKFIPINLAEVYVTDGEKDYWYHLSDSNGMYQSNVPFKGLIGKVYTLNVLYADKYYTASDSMNICDSIIDYPVENIRFFDSHIEIHSNEHNFGFSKPSIWTFIERPLDSVNRFPNIEFNYFDVRFYFLYNHRGSLPQGVFPSGFSSTGVSGDENDTLEIVKISISDSYYNYLVSYFNITAWNSGIFSTIPGNTKTNVSDGGTGYFYCTNLKRFRMTYKDLNEIIE